MTPNFPLSVADVRALIHEELRKAGLRKAEPMGLPVLIDCSCERERCTTLKVVPCMSHGERCVDLMIMGTGGVVLDQAKRDALADILNDKDWFGDHADLRE